MAPRGGHGVPRAVVRGQGQCTDQIGVGQIGVGEGVGAVANRGQPRGAVVAVRDACRSSRHSATRSPITCAHRPGRPNRLNPRTQSSPEATRRRAQGKLAMQQNQRRRLTAVKTSVPWPLPLLLCPTYSLQSRKHQHLIPELQRLIVSLLEHVFIHCIGACNIRIPINSPSFHHIG